MSTPLLIQSTVGKVTLYLEHALDGTPATGLAFSDVTVDLQRSGGAFASKVLDVTNFVVLNGGFYELTLTVVDTSILGNLYIRVNGALIRTTLTSAFIADAAPTAPTTTTPPTTTSMFGFVYDSSGAPVVNAGVAATILSVPTVLNPGDGMAVTTETVSTKTDASGYFILELITGMLVDVFIPSTGYRRTLTVPGSSTNIFELP